METTMNSGSRGQGFAIAGLVIGIVAIILAIIPCLNIAALFFGIMAVIFSSLAYSQANKDNQPRGIALGGIIISSIAIFIAVLWLVIFASFTDKIKHHFHHFNWEEFESFEDCDDSKMESFEDFEKEFNDMDATKDKDAIKDKEENMKSMDELEKDLDALENEKPEKEETKSK